MNFDLLSSIQLEIPECMNSIFESELLYVRYRICLSVLPVYKLPKIPDILIIPCDRFKFYWEAIMRDKFAFTALSSPSDNWHNQLKPLFTRACNHKNAPPRPLLSSRGVGSYIELGGQCSNVRGTICTSGWYRGNWSAKTWLGKCPFCPSISYTPVLKLDYNF